MTYYASSSTDGLNNTNWSFSATGGFYFAYNSIDSGNNNGWVFQSFALTNVNQTAERDQNSRTTLLGTSNDSNTTGTLRVEASPTTHALIVSDNTTGINYGYTNADRDSNYIPAIMATSSQNGTTPVPIYVDSVTGALLITST